MTSNKQETMQMLLENPLLVQRELNNRSYYVFLLYFWSELTQEPYQDAWHIQYLCDELQIVGERVGERKKKLYDILINIPPGTTKTTICLRAFPAWVWTRWFHIQFLTGSYSSTLSLESAEDCRELIRSEKFKAMYPELGIKEDKDQKSNYKVIKKTIDENLGRRGKGVKIGGYRYSTSVGGSLTGFHGHILIWDDLNNPKPEKNATPLETTNHWFDSVSSTRKVDKSVSVTIIIQQRIHQNDISGHLLAKKKTNLKHICLPGELSNGYDKYVQPPELKERYINGLLDPNRLNKEALLELEADLGQYGYAGQVGQNPTPPGGGMFKVEKFQTITQLPPDYDMNAPIRYWDKAGTAGGGAYTTGVKVLKTKQDRYIVLDVKRGQWSSEDRETMIKQTAEADGRDVKQFIEQEPGSGGKESAENTVKMLAGFLIEAERPVGNKVYRADPWSVQINWGNVMLLHGDWNHEFVEEHRFFPFGKYKDQVDAAGAAFAKLTSKKETKSW